MTVPVTAESTRSVVADSASSAVWTLASRVTGFGRVVLVGAVLGPSFVGNLFQLANQLPWLVFEITVGSLLGSLLVPALMVHVGDAGRGDRADLDALSRLASAFTVTVVAGFGAVAAAVMLASPLLARLFALGVPDDVHDDLVRAAIPLVVLTAPQLVGYGLTVTAQSVQQALGSYRLPAAAGIVENAVVIATLVVYAVVFETGTAVDRFDGPRLALLGLGSTLGVAAHVALQGWGVHRLGLRFTRSSAWREPEVRSLVRRAATATGSAALNGVRILGLLVVANSVAGGVVAVQLGLNLVGVAVALGAKPVAYAVLPRLAVRAAAADLRGYRDDYARGIGLAGLVVIPAAIAAGLLGWLVGPALAVGEMNTSNGRELLAITVAAIAGSVLGESLHQLGVAASYGRDRTRPPLLAFALRLGLTVAALPVVFGFDGTDRILVLVVAMSVADLVSGAVLHRSVDRDLPRPGAGDYAAGRSVARTAVSALVGFAAVAAAARTLDDRIGDGRAAQLFLCAAAAGLGGAITMVVRHRFDDELAGLVGQWRGRS